MPTITPSAANKTAIVTKFKTDMDSGGAAGRIRCYTGVKPAGPDTAITNQVLLGTLTCSYPCGTVLGNELTFSPITSDAADASGTFTWARFENSLGVAQYDVDVSTAGGVGFIKMNTVNIVELGPIILNSVVISA